MPKAPKQKITLGIIDASGSSTTRDTSRRISKEQSSHPVVANGTKAPIPHHTSTPPSHLRFVKYLCKHAIPTPSSIANEVCMYSQDSNSESEEPEVRRDQSYQLKRVEVPWPTRGRLQFEPLCDHKGFDFVERDISPDSTTSSAPESIETSTSIPGSAHLAEPIDVSDSSHEIDTAIPAVSTSNHDFGPPALGESIEIDYANFLNASVPDDWTQFAQPRWQDYVAVYQSSPSKNLSRNQPGDNDMISIQGTKDRLEGSRSGSSESLDHHHRREFSKSASLNQSIDLSINSRLEDDCGMERNRYSEGEVGSEDREPHTEEAEPDAEEEVESISKLDSMGSPFEPAIIEEIATEEQVSSVGFIDTPELNPARRPGLSEVPIYPFSHAQYLDLPEGEYILAPETIPSNYSSQSPERNLDSAPIDHGENFLQSEAETVGENDTAGFVQDHTLNLSSSVTLDYSENQNLHILLKYPHFIALKRALSDYLPDDVIPDSQSDTYSPLPDEYIPLPQSTSTPAILSASTVPSPTASVIPVAYPESFDSVAFTGITTDSPLLPEALESPENYTRADREEFPDDLVISDSDSEERRAFGSDSSFGSFARNEYVWPEDIEVDQYRQDN